MRGFFVVASMWTNKHSTHPPVLIKARRSRYRKEVQGTNEEQEDDEDKNEDPDELQKQRAMDDWKDGMYASELTEQYIHYYFGFYEISLTRSNIFFFQIIVADGETEKTWVERLKCLQLMDYSRSINHQHNFLYCHKRLC